MKKKQEKLDPQQLEEIIRFAKKTAEEVRRVHRRICSKYVKKPERRDKS